MDRIQSVQALMGKYQVLTVPVFEPYVVYLVFRQLAIKIKQLLRGRDPNSLMKIANECFSPLPMDVGRNDALHS